MKKQFIFFASVVLMTTSITSCSTATEEKTEPVQVVVPVQKSARMLSFESSLKDWFKSRHEANGGTLNKKASEAILAPTKALLTEIGIDQNQIENKSKLSEEALVSFAMEEYSKKLTALYNQNNK
jgi:hypothetical protein